MTEHVYKTTPYAHQREAFELSRDRKYFALLMQMRTGKSKVFVDTAAWLFNKGAINAVLVVVPNSIAMDWKEKHFAEHLPDTVQRRHIVVWEGGSGKKKQIEMNELFQPDPLCLKVLVINIEAFSQGNAKRPGRAYVLAEAFLRSHDVLFGIDESTRIKSPDASRTKNILRLRDLARYRRILTGRIAPQSPLDVYCQFEFLADNLLMCGNYYGFRHRYALLRRRVINGRSFDEVVGYQRVDELSGLIARHSYRRLRSECQDFPDELPPVTRWVEMGEEQERLYAELRDTAVAELSSANIVTAPLFLTRLLRLRQLLAGHLVTNEKEIIEIPCPRIAELLSWTEEIEGKAVIWCCFKPSLRRVTRELLDKYGPGSAAPFYGEVSTKERQDTKARFQDPKDPLRWLVGQAQTGGLGLDFSVADDTIYYDIDWSNEYFEQSRDRTLISGKSRAVSRTHLAVRGTIDERMLTALEEHQTLANLVTGDGWRHILTTEDMSGRMFNE